MWGVHNLKQVYPDPPIIVNFKYDVDIGDVIPYLALISYQQVHCNSSPLRYKRSTGVGAHWGPRQDHQLRDTFHQVSVLFENNVDDLLIGAKHSNASH